MGPRILGVALVLCAVVEPVVAQVDPSGTYRTWTTEHFRIHARVELRDPAGRVAREAERAWGLLALELRPPNGRVDITLLDTVDVANGVATVFPSNRITLFLSSPAGDTSLGSFDDWLRTVVIHELTHIFHLDRTRGFWRVPRALFGRAPALFPNSFQPTWVIEGIATYYESRLTTGGRVRGAFHSQLLAALAGDGWPRPGDAGAVGPGWPGGVASYAWGSRYLARQTALHGDSVVPNFIEATAGQLWPLRTSRPLVRAGGDPLEPGWEDLEAASRVVAAPRGRVLVRGLLSEPRPSVAEDGRRVAYVHTDGRQSPRVAVFDWEEDRVAPWALGPVGPLLNGGAEVAWSEGSLYVAQLDFGSPVELWSDLYRWRPSRGLERLTSHARLTAPFRLTDGTLGVRTTRPGAHAAGAFDLARGVLAVLPTPPADDWGRLAASPDGSWMAGARHRGGQWDLVAWPTGEPHQALAVTSDPALDADPAWSPTGDLIVFVSERDGLPQIFGYRLADRRLTRMTDEPTGARHPVVMHDGTLLYSSVLSDGHALLTADPGEREIAGTEGAPTGQLTPAASISSRETGYRPWVPLRPSYWLPFVTRGGGSGTFLGFATSGQDPVERMSYGATLTGALATGRVDGAIGVSYSRWRAFSVDASARQDWSFAGTSFVGERFSNRERLLGSSLTWRSRRWRSSAFLRVGAEWEGDRIVNDSRPAAPAADQTARWGPVASARWSRSDRSPYAISPENGFELSTWYRRPFEVSGDRRAHEWIGAASGFLALPLPGFARWVLATNARIGVVAGTLPGLWGLGGESGALVELAPGVTFGDRRSFPLRAYPAGAGFRRVATGSLELRIPLLLVGRGVWKLPFGLDRVSGQLFADVGSGWNEGGPRRFADFVGVGAEGVLDVTVQGVGAFRVRLGIGVPVRSGLAVEAGQERVYVAFGPSF